jgi:Protein of unknown function (DUF2434)
MSVPRSWSKIPRQGGLAQQTSVAKPAATDGRFKAAAIFLACAYIVMVYYVRHTLHYYKPHSRGVGSVKTLFTQLPIRFPLAFAVVAVFIGYDIASTWIFNISIMKYNSSPIWPFALGYAPCLLFIIIFNIWGFMAQNEDKQIIKQRIELGRAADATLGLTHKPNWWSKARGDHHLDDLSRLRRLVDEQNPEHGIAGADKKYTSKSGATENFELQNVHTTATDPFTDSNEARSRSVSRTRPGEEPDRDLLTANRTTQQWMARTPSATSMSSAMTGQTLGTTSGSLQQRQPQQVRSMLDI